jgi:hypothetical protein
MIQDSGALPLDGWRAKARSIGTLAAYMPQRELTASALVAVPTRARKIVAGQGDALSKPQSEWRALRIIT